MTKYIQTIQRCKISHRRKRRLEALQELSMTLALLATLALLSGLVGYGIGVYDVEIASHNRSQMVTIGGAR